MPILLNKEGPSVSLKAQVKQFQKVQKIREDINIPLVNGKPFGNNITPTQTKVWNVIVWSLHCLLYLKFSFYRL